MSSNTPTGRVAQSPDHTPTPMLALPKNFQKTPVCQFVRNGLDKLESFGVYKQGYDEEWDIISVLFKNEGGYGRFKIHPPNLKHAGFSATFLLKSEDYSSTISRQDVGDLVRTAIRFTRKW